MSDPGVNPVEVAAAVITDGAGRVLVARRPEGVHLAGMDEFPGGKVRPGEAPGEACRRECREELGVEVVVGEPILPRAVHAYPGRTVALTFYRCALAAGSPAPRAIEAARVRWVEPARLAELRFPEANRAVLAALARPEGTKEPGEVAAAALTPATRPSP